jgi:hypothetical protein
MNPNRLYQDLSGLLQWLCINWGFCIPPTDFERIASRQYIEADTFAREVLLSEGMNPEFEIRWFRKIKQRFTDKFGFNSVDASNYNR